MLVFLEDVVVDDADVESLESFPRSESQGALDGDVVGSGVGRPVFRPVIDQNSLVQVSSVAADGSGELSDVLHHRVVARIEEDADLAVGDVEPGVGRAGRSHHLVQVAGRPVHGFLDQIGATGEFARRLDPVEGPALWARVGQFLAGQGLDGPHVQVRVFLAQLAQQLDVLAPVLFELADVVVHLLLVESLESGIVDADHFDGVAAAPVFPPVVLVVALRFDDDAPPVDAVLFGDVLVEEEAPVGDVGRDDGGREEEESDDALPDFDDADGDDGQDDVEPDVGEDGPSGRDEEDAQVLDLAHLALGNDVDAQADDHEQVEGGRADDCARAEVAGLEILGVHFDDGEEDLRSGRAEGHQTQVGHRFVPDADDDDLDVAVGFLDSDFLLLRRDDFDGAHEPVGDDRHAHEQVAHGDKVDQASCHPVAQAHVGERPPHGDQQPVLALAVF